MILTITSTQTNHKTRIHYLLFNLKKCITIVIYLHKYKSCRYNIHTIYYTYTVSFARNLIINFITLIDNISNI